MPKRLIIVPRWAGNSDSDWYPWLRQSIEQTTQDAFEWIDGADMPRPEQPTIAAWSARVAELVGTDPLDVRRTVLIGHSVGCLAILHYLASLSNDIRVSGVLCVAGWWRVDNPWDSLLPWSETPLDIERVRRAAEQCVVLLSDNDPFVSDWRANKHEWEDKLKATVYVICGAQHFNAPVQSAVLENLMEHFAKQDRA